MISMKQFMARPNVKIWDREIAEGWEGPDGSTASTDHIMGVRIGITSPDAKYRRMPANLHDYRYHLGRKHNLASRYRLAADVEYREGCVREISETLDGKTMVAIGIARSWVRYYVLRLFGWKAFR